MNRKPDWLPDMISVDPWTGSIFDELYQVFRQDFLVTQPIYKNQRVWIFPDKNKGKEDIFWHLTSQENRRMSDRVPSPDRCKRLPWIRSVIENSYRPEVKNWDYEEGDGTIKTYLWVEALDYLVILKKYQDGGRRLITAFCVGYKNTRHKLEKKYQNRL